MEQGDFFNTGPAQLGFALEDTSRAKSYEPDRDEVRQELLVILSEAKSAIDACPWDQRTFLYNKVVFPQMANWLPPEERDRLRAEFAIEIERIESLMQA